MMQAHPSASDTQTLSASQPGESAMLLLKQGKEKEAEAYLHQAVRLQPSNAQWHLELARLQRLHDRERAKKTYGIAQSLGSINAEFEVRALSEAPGAIEYLDPNEIWQTDRLDVAVKLLFARSLLNPAATKADIAHALYRRHILHRTNGVEPESSSKTSQEDYELCFQGLLASIQKNGFPDKFAIPIDCNNRILNGAHRLAAALALQLDRVPVVRMPPTWHALDWGMAWFLRHDFSPEEINLLLGLWADAHPDQIGLFVIEHWGSGVPEDCMHELHREFPLLAWRDLHPTVALTSLSHQETPPRGPWRYVLVNKREEATFRTFATSQNEKYAHRLHCRALSGDASLTWITQLLDEPTVASWHPESPSRASNASSIASWMRYGEQAKATAPLTQPNFLKWRNLQLLEDIHTVIDVGVANGTPDLFNHIKPKHVIFIEPVPLFKERIQALQMQFPSSQYFPVGLSSQDQESTINYRKDWPILTSLLKSSPLRDTGSEEIEQMPVSLRKLDTLFPEFQNIDGPILLKIDTEGYELEVLKGAVASLSKIKYLVLEVSVIERFEESYTCRELFAFLQEHNFILQTCLSASVDAEGFCRVIDAVFCNTSLS
ncbi:FkbM family methyltransferase [Oxalicibacterium faecigallinarum]|nr:FkbM family methyltransferase [Oxalicibacterium faecigallinarum]